MARKPRERRKKFRDASAGNAAVVRKLHRWFDDNRLICVTIAIFLTHTIGLVCLFTPLNGILDSQPIIEQDWGLHFHHLAALESFWKNDRMLWGYNPYFMAGYPSNTIQDLSIKFFEFAALALSGLILTPLHWFKIAAFTAMASVPWLGYFAARNLFCADDRKNLIATTAALLGTVYWWNSLPREMFFYGMIGFPVAAYLSVMVVCLFYRLAARAESFGWIHAGWLVFAAAILPLHAQSIIMILPPVIALLTCAPALISMRLAGWSVAALIVAVTVNLPWLAPAFAHRGDDVSAAIVEQLPIFAGVNPLAFFLDYLGPQGFWTFRSPLLEKGFRLALLVAGLLGIRSLFRDGSRVIGILLVSAVSGMFILTYFGTVAPALRAWQPLRFKIALDLFLAVPAAYEIAQWISGPRDVSSKLVPALMGVGLFTFVLNLIQTEASGRLQLRTQMNPQITALVDWIAKESPPEGRILFEESGDETGFVYDGAYLSSLLAQRTSRQFIGGPINLYNDRHHFAQFNSGKIFKKSIQDVSEADLRNYLNLYNIGAVVAFHPASIKKLQAIPGLVSLDRRIGPVHLMKVRQPLSWLIKGEGKVKPAWNRLELSDLAGDEVILKYHWVDGLTASPPTTIEPIQLADDPIPFIKLANPPVQVTLQVR